MKKETTSLSNILTRKTERDIYQEVTDRIIKALEKGVVPWQRPWHSARGDRNIGLPVNVLTEKSYQGINVLLLWLSANCQGFLSNNWLTYRQAQQLGGYVRKGEKATETVIFKPLKVAAKDQQGKLLQDENGKPVMREIPLIRTNLLFNVAQCEHLPDHIVQPREISYDTLEMVSAPVMNQILEILNASGVKATCASQTQAYYKPSDDCIVLPLFKQFFTEADYWATLLHELVHSTGHSKRLNREGITSSSRRFGDAVYAFEELLAEMGSAFLCAQLGVHGEVNHESYLQIWLTILRADKKALFRAARQAREASEFLLALNKTTQKVA